MNLWVGWSWKQTSAVHVKRGRLAECQRSETKWGIEGIVPFKNQACYHEAMLLSICCKEQGQNSSIHSNEETVEGDIDSTTPVLGDSMATSTVFDCLWAQLLHQASGTGISDFRNGRQGAQKGGGKYRSCRAVVSPRLLGGKRWSFNVWRMVQYPKILKDWIFNEPLTLNIG